MKKWLLFSLVSIQFVSCDRNEGVKTNDAHSNQNLEAVDNTGRNVRDRDMSTLTPGNQSDSAMDLSITQNIRQALMADDSLSTNAKNSKIITISGLVTLRGPVETNQEKDQIAKIASAVSGVKKVDNQLEVSKSN